MKHPIKKLFSLSFFLLQIHTTFSCGQNFFCQPLVPQPQEQQVGYPLPGSYIQPLLNRSLSNGYQSQSPCGIAKIIFHNGRVVPTSPVNAMLYNSIKKQSR